MARIVLKDRLVLITGGARGIGKATAAAFRRQGCRIAIADLDLKTAEETARSMDPAQHDVRAYALDVTQQQAFHDVIAAVERDMGPVDILINNAGIMSAGNFLEQSESTDHRQIDINVFGVIHGMRAVMPGMLKRGFGHVVNVASLAGCLGCPQLVLYSASKFAVVGLTQAARIEFKKTPLRFSCVMPAPVDTELMSGANIMQWPPLLRPEQVANAVLRAVRANKAEVMVPWTGLISKLLPLLFPLKITDWVADFLGLTRMFVGHDAKRRAGYEARALGAGESNSAPAEHSKKVVGH